MDVEVTLLGQPSVSRGGERVTPPKGRKAWALLAYVALAERAPSRQRLAGLLFGEADDPMAALRWNLAELRRVLGNSDALRGDPIELQADRRVHRRRRSQPRAVDRRDRAPRPRSRSARRNGVRCCAGVRRVVAHRAATPARAGGLDAARSRARAGCIGSNTRPRSMSRSDSSSWTRSTRTRRHCSCAPSPRPATGPARKSGSACAPTCSSASSASSPRPDCGSRPRCPPARRRSRPSVAGPPCAPNSKQATPPSPPARSRPACSACAGRWRKRKRAATTICSLDRSSSLGSALVHAVRGRDLEGAAALHDAIGVAEPIGADTIVASACRELGFVDVQQGRHERAELWLERAETLAGSDVAELARVNGIRGMALSDSARYPEAIATLQRSIEFARDADAAKQAAWSLSLLGRAHLLRGDYELATAAARRERRPRPRRELDRVPAVAGGTQRRARVARRPCRARRRGLRPRVRAGVPDRRSRAGKDWRDGEPD